MKKILLLAILIASPLIGQENTEKETKKGIDYKRPIFGLNFGIGGGFYSSFSLYVNDLPNNDLYVSLSIIPEFYIGNHHSVYFYIQLPLYGYLFPNTSILNQLGSGVLIGMGGYILEANNSDRWSLIMNGAIGPAISYGYRHDHNLTSESIAIYAATYLSLDARYHINSIYAIQFGINAVLNFAIFSDIGWGINTQVGFVF